MEWGDIMADTNQIPVYVVIPAFEPDEKLISVVNGITEETDFRIILVNDGSGADYDGIFSQCKDKTVYLEHEKNRGKGAALKTAFSYLKEQDSPFVVVTADADGQHKLSDIIRVSEAVSERPERLTMGCRKFTGEIPLRSRFGNSVTKYVYSFAAGVKVSDTQTGLRGFMSDKLDFMLSVSGERYEYEMNMLLECARAGTGFNEVPIETVYIGENETSHFHPLADSVRIYRDIIKFSCASFVSFIVDYLLYTVFLLLTKNLIASNIMARVLSASFNFTMNKRYVFRNKDKLLPTAVKYFALAAFILAANTLILDLLVKFVIPNEFISKIIVEILLFMLSWTVQRTVVFRTRKGKDRNVG